MDIWEKGNAGREGKRVEEGAGESGRVEERGEREEVGKGERG